MKTKLLKAFFLLLAIKGASQTINPSIVFVESCETVGTSCNGNAGAYFDLTTANARLLGNLNPNDYQFVDYQIDNDFSPSQPVTPINNFYRCEGLVNQAGVSETIISVRIERINDSQNFFTGYIKLIWVKKPTLVVNNNSVYPSFLQNGEIYRPSCKFSFRLDNAATTTLGYSLNNIPVGTHTITYKALNTTGYLSTCEYTETVVIDGNFPTNVIKTALTFPACVNANSTQSTLTFNLTQANPILLGSLLPSNYTLEYRNRDNGSLITTPTNYVSEIDKFIDVKIIKNSDQTFYFGEIKLFKVQSASYTIQVINNTAIATATTNGNFLYALKLQGQNFGTPQVSNIFNSLPAGNHTMKVINNEGCGVEQNFTIVAPVAPVQPVVLVNTTLLFNSQIIDLTVNNSFFSNQYSGSNKSVSHYLTFEDAYLARNPVNAKSFNSASAISQKTYVRVESATVLPYSINSSNLVGYNTLSNTLGTFQFNESSFSIYPIPTKDFLTIDGKNSSDYNVTILDLLGKKVKSKTVNNSNTTIDLSDLPKGVYLAKIKSENEEKIMKIIKE